MMLKSEYDFIAFERSTVPGFKHDFDVLINGEHRARFRSNKWMHRAGYNFETLHGAQIPHGRGRHGPVIQAEFEAVAREALANNLIPTRAEIDRLTVMHFAEKEDRERDAAIAQRKTELRGNVMRAALARYIEEERDAEHLGMARALLRDWERR